jgi:hypothetical protein
VIFLEVLQVSTGKTPKGKNAKKKSKPHRKAWKFFKKKIFYDEYYEKFEIFKEKSIDFFDNIKNYEEELSQKIQ